MRTATVYESWLAYVAAVEAEEARYQLKQVKQSEESREVKSPQWWMREFVKITGIAPEGLRTVNNGDLQEFYTAADAARQTARDEMRLRDQRLDTPISAGSSYVARAVERAVARENALTVAELCALDRARNWLWARGGKFGER